MKKLFALGSVLALTALFSSPASACSITCPGGASCSSTNGDCHCDGNSPHCVDNPTKITQEYVAYLQTWNTPGLNRVADAASKALEASDANDLQGYQRATRNYNEALQKLTKTERQLISAWESDTHQLINAREQ